MTVQSK